MVDSATRGTDDKIDASNISFTEPRMCVFGAAIL